MVAFRSSASGISVISNIGPTMPGMKQILFWPEREKGHRHIKQLHDMQVLLRPSLGKGKKRGRIVKSIVTTYKVVCQGPGAILNTLHILIPVRGACIIQYELLY